MYSLYRELLHYSMPFHMQSVHIYLLAIHCFLYTLGRNFHISNLRFLTDESKNWYVIVPASQQRICYSLKFAYSRTYQTYRFLAYNSVQGSLATSTYISGFQEQWNWNDRSQAVNDSWQSQHNCNYYGNFLLSVLIYD